MEWSRVKNILIILLLFVNGFLFVAYLNSELTQRRAEENTRKNTHQIITRLGIEIDLELIPGDSDILYPARIERDLSKEEDIAGSVLGEFTKTESGGGKITYSGKNGVIGFRNGGLFDMEIKTAGELRPERVRSIALESLKPFNIHTDSGLVSVEETRDGYVVNVPQLFSKFKVFNCLNTVKINSDGLLSVSGRRAADNIIFMRGFQSRSISGLLLDFIDKASDIKAITELESGFIVETVSGTGMNLVPVWRIKADNTDYYISSVSGELVTVN